MSKRSRLREFLTIQTQSQGCCAEDRKRLWTQFFTEALATDSDSMFDLEYSMLEAIKGAKQNKLRRSIEAEYTEKMAAFFRSSDLDTRLRLAADLSFNKLDLIGRIVDLQLQSFLKKEEIVPTKKVSLFWRRTSLVQRAKAAADNVPLDLKAFPGGIFVWRRDLNEALKTFCSFKPVANSLKAVAAAGKPIELIFRADAISMKDATVTLFSLGFPSLGMPSKSPYLLVPVAAVNGKDTDLEAMRAWLGPIVAEVQAFFDKSKFPIEICQHIGLSKEAWPCKIFIGGDDPFMRAIMGLAGSGSIWLCLFCTHGRAVQRMASMPGPSPGATHNPPSKGPILRETLRKAVKDGVNPNPCTKELGYRVDANGQLVQPLFDVKSWWQYVIDVLHALLSIGRVLCKFIIDSYARKAYSTIQAIDTLDETARKQILAPLVIFISITCECKRLGRKMAKGKKIESSILRGVKGGDARRLFSHIEDFKAAQLGNISDAEVGCIIEVRKICDFLFSHPDETKKNETKFGAEGWHGRRTWVIENASRVFADFSRRFDSGDKNYIHELGFHLPYILKVFPEGIYLYSTDVQESLNAIFASGRFKWSNNGGGKRKCEVSSVEWIQQVLTRFLLKQQYLLELSPKTVGSIFRLSQRRAEALAGE